MTTDEILSYCLAKKCAIIDYPFGSTPICLKVKSKIFAQIYPKSSDLKITLKCEPVFGDFYRQMYPGCVLRGYHCPPVQQPYWNTVLLDGTVSDDLIKLMIDHAFQTVIRGLPEYQKKDFL